jgi:hypothetical protein
MSRISLKFAVLAALGVAAAACSEPVGNTDTTVATDPRMNSTDPGYIRITKFSVTLVDNPDAAQVTDAVTTSGTFRVMAYPQNVQVGSDVTLTWPAAQYTTAFPIPAGTTSLTVTETPSATSALWFYRFIINNEYQLPYSNVVGPTNSPVTVTIPNVDPTKGYELQFKNVPFTPPPPPGRFGCTPGFWRNSFGSWVTYAPTDRFETVFARNVFPTSDPTLGQTIALGNGGVNALARHATAALLNAAAGFYPYTTAQVISRFQAAFDSGDAATIEAQKDDFDAKNNLGCPLSNDNSNTGR